MNCENLWEEVLKSARSDSEYLWYRNLVQDAEKGYLEACQSLSPEQKLAIEDYVAAIEHLGDYLVFFSYELGRGSK